MLKSNLSIQVHPGPEQGEYGPSKAELWCILEAEEGAGVYLGLKEGVEPLDFLEGKKEPTDLLNFVPVQAGDIFEVPPGIMHAIGAGVLLLELQESSESTYRVYDWNRRDEDGQERPLHLKESMELCDWEGLRGEKLVQQLSCKTGLFTFNGFHAQFFTDSILKLASGEVQGVTVLEGSVQLGELTVKQGESVLIPAACAPLSLRGEDAFFMVVMAQDLHFTGGSVEETVFEDYLS